MQHHKTHFRKGARAALMGGLALALACPLAAPLPGTSAVAAGGPAAVERAEAATGATALDLSNGTLASRAYYQGDLATSATSSRYDHILYVRGDTLYKCASASTDAGKTPLKDDGNGNWVPAGDSWWIDQLEPDLYQKMVTDGGFNRWPTSTSQGTLASQLRNHSGYALVNPDDEAAKWTVISFEPQKISGKLQQTAPSNYAAGYYVVPVFSVDMDAATVEQAGQVQEQFVELQGKADRTAADVAAFREVYDSFVTDASGKVQLPRVMLFANTDLPELLGQMEDEAAAVKSAPDVTAAQKLVDALASNDDPEQSDLDEVEDAYNALDDKKAGVTGYDEAMDAAQAKVFQKQLDEISAKLDSILNKDVEQLQSTYENELRPNVRKLVALNYSTVLAKAQAAAEENEEKAAADKAAADKEESDRVAAAAVDAAAKTLSEMEHPTQADVDSVIAALAQLDETQKGYLTRDVPADIDAAWARAGAASDPSRGTSGSPAVVVNPATPTIAVSPPAPTIEVNPASPAVSVTPAAPDVTVNEGEVNVTVAGIDDLAVALRFQTELCDLALNPTAGGLSGVEAGWQRLSASQQRLVSGYERAVAFAERALESPADCASAAPAVAPAKKTARVRTITVNTKKVTARAVSNAVKKARRGGKACTCETVTKVVLGKKVEKVRKGAFKKLGKCKTLVVKTKRLSKKGANGALKGSKVRTVKVQVSKSKMANRKYVKKYRKAFAKKNGGKKVRVR